MSDDFLITDLLYAMLIVGGQLFVCSFYGRRFYLILFEPLSSAPLFRGPFSLVQFLENGFRLSISYLSIATMYSFSGAAIATYISIAARGDQVAPTPSPTYLLVPFVVGTLYGAAIRTLIDHAEFSRITVSLYFQMIVVAGRFVVIPGAMGTDADRLG